MRSQKSTKLSKRAYKKWVERFRMSFHVEIGIVCAFLYLILANVNTVIPPEAALLLFGIDFLVALIQWNQHRLYRFANSSRYMKGIPEEKLQVINGMYLVLFLFLTGGLAFLLLQLPLVEIGTSAVLWIRDVLRSVFSGFARTAMDSAVAETTSAPGMLDYFAELRGDRTTGAVGKIFEKVVIVFGICLTCILVIYALVTLYRTVWQKVRFQFDDEVTMIEKEDREERMGKKRISFADEMRRDPRTQFRKAYRKMIRRRMKKGSAPNPAWTPEEIEAFAGLQKNEGQNQKIHEMYEKIRYAEDEIDKTELEELRKLMK